MDPLLDLLSLKLSIVRADDNSRDNWGKGFMFEGVFRVTCLGPVRQCLYTCHAKYLYVTCTIFHMLCCYYLFSIRL